MKVAARAEAFDGGDALALDRLDPRRAAAQRLAGGRDGAGAAERRAAAELRALQAQMIAQHPEERRVGLDVDALGAAVDGERDHRESPQSSGELLRPARGDAVARQRQGPETLAARPEDGVGE